MAAQTTTILHQVDLKNSEMNTPNANMADLSVSPGLVARKRGLESFVLTVRLSDSVDQYGFLQVVTCLRAIKEEI